jgi:3-oxoadipate enol-lactonase
MTAAFTLKTKGLTVNIRVEGTGPKLLFLGGSNFDLSLNTRIFDSKLAQHFTVAAADPRGLGGTDGPAGDWTMGDYAQDALDILDALGWDSAHVLGESFGVMTALHMAAMAPGRITRLALAAGSAGGAGGSSYPIQTLRDIADKRKRAQTALGVMDDRFTNLMDTDPAQAQDLVNMRINTEAAFMANGKNAQNHPRLLTARAGHDAWHMLPAITIPTLVFAGRYDKQAPLDRAENIVQAMPNAALHIVEGGHSICFATPEPVAIILQHWTN